MEYENLILQQLDQMDLDSLFQIADLARDHNGGTFLVDLKQFILGIANGNISLETKPILIELSNLFLEQVRDSLSTCSLILAVCIISGLLNHVTESFGNRTVSKTTNAICLLIVILHCIRQFLEIYQYGEEQITLMITAVQSLFPVLIPLVLASGQAIAGAILNPAILGVIAMISTVIDQWILPGVFLSCTLCIMGRLTSQSFLNRSGKLLKDIIVLAVGFTVTVLSAFTTIQGAVGKTADSLILKTARFSVDNFIPIIGGFASDSMDMVISCTSTIKNAVGLWGILLLLVLLLFPLIKMAAIILIYRVFSVLAEAVSERSISDCLEDVASAVTTLSVIYTLMGILFIVFVSILITLT